MYEKLLGGLVISCIMFFASAVLAAVTPLASTSWLADHLDDRNVVIIDVRTATNYGVGHIPGSVNIPYGKWEPMQGKTHTQMMLGPEQLGGLLRENGVSAESHVIVYDHGNAIGDATKGTAIVWILSANGHENITYLNGGFTKWTFEGRIIDNKKPTPAPGDFKSHLDADKVTDIAELISKIKDGNITLVDARNSNQHFGTKKRVDVERFGHIPGSINLPAPFLSDAGINRAPATIRDTIILQDIATGVGIPEDKNQEIIVYCNTGQYAGMDYFVLHYLLGYRNVSVYDASMLEYGGYDELSLDRYSWGHIKQ